MSLRVEEGEVVALLGPNGEARPPDLRGHGHRAAVVGESAPRRTGRDVCIAGEKVRKGIGISPEGRRVFSNLTVAENLQLGASAQPDKEMRADSRQNLEMFPILKQRYRQKAGTLSGGEQQQLAISRCRMSRPRIVMLDEPSLGLAPVIVETIST